MRDLLLTTYFLYCSFTLTPPCTNNISITNQQTDTHTHLDLGFQHLCYGSTHTKQKIQNKKLKGGIKRREKHFQEAAYKAANSELLLTEQGGFLEPEGIEKTYQLTQRALGKEVDVSTSHKMFNLDLKFGPYAIDYTRNGRHLLIGGRKGHVAAFDWQGGNLACELQLRETVRDVTYGSIFVSVFLRVHGIGSRKLTKSSVLFFLVITFFRWLHNETMFAVAQKKYVYIYDKTGTEIHCLRNHIEVTKMDFLPYHFLLTTIVSFDRIGSYSIRNEKEIAPSDHFL